MRGRLVGAEGTRPVPSGLPAALCRGRVRTSRRRRADRTIARLIEIRSRLALPLRAGGVVGVGDPFDCHEPRPDLGIEGAEVGPLEDLD